MNHPIAYSRPGRARRRRLYHSPKRRDWFPWETDKLIQLVEAGYSYDQIAKKTGRTRTAVELKCRRLNVRITTTPATLSAHDIAVLLGLGCSKTVASWIRIGWLPARNAGSAAKPLWRVQWEDLTDFMERHECWMAWRPERITDLALREWAHELRAGQPRWLTAGEVARRLGVGRDTPHQWATKKLIPATKYGNLWFREDHVAGFVIPADRPRTSRHRQSLLTKIEALLTETPQTADAIAATLGARLGSVQHALRTMERRGQAARPQATDWRATSFGRIRKEAPARDTRWRLPHASV